MQALKVFQNRRIFVTTLLGFSSGLPLPLVMGTLTAWMVTEHVNLKTIGIFSLVGTPYTVKYLWAPLLDRYIPPFLNRRTGWMAISQVALIFSIIAMGCTDPVRQQWQMACLAVVTAFLSATQDIVIDAYRAELLTPEELGAGAGVTVMGGRIALLTAGSLALILSDHISWKYVYFVMAGLMTIGLVTSIFAPPPTAAVKPPRTLTKAVVEPFSQFFVQQRGALVVLLFVIFYKFGDAMAGLMTTPCILQLGFTKTDIGAVNKGLGMVASIVGSLIGGGVVAKIGIISSLWIFGFLQAISNMAFSGMAMMGHHYPSMIAAIGIENFCSGMGTAAFVAFLMSLTNKNYTATQYALLSSVMAIGRTIAGIPAGMLAVKVSWPLYFVICTLCAAPGLLLLFWCRRSYLKN